MATDVLLPQWGMSMTEGTVVAWVVNEGEAIEEGDELVEIETAKATDYVMAPASGIVARIDVQVDETVPCGTRLAVIAAPGETLPRVAPKLRQPQAPRTTATVRSAAGAHAPRRRAATHATPPAGVRAGA